MNDERKYLKYILRVIEEELDERLFGWAKAQAEFVRLIKGYKIETSNDIGKVDNKTALILKEKLENFAKVYDIPLKALLKKRFRD